MNAYRLTGTGTIVIRMFRHILIPRSEDWNPYILTTDSWVRDSSFTIYILLRSKYKIVASRPQKNFGIH
jgi:hypothetical protein